MEAVLGVGGPRRPVGGGFDFWLPTYMVLTFLLARSVVGLRHLTTAGIAAFVGGTLWAWSANGLGVIPAAALAVLVAIVVGGIRRRGGWQRIPPR